MIKKNLANIVTSGRIVGAIVLFCCNDFSALYLGMYCYCGFTDFIDGPIARKTGSSSDLSPTFICTVFHINKNVGKDLTDETVSATILTNRQINYIFYLYLLSFLKGNITPRRSSAFD